MDIVLKRADKYSISHRHIIYDGMIHVFLRLWLSMFKISFALPANVTTLEKKYQCLQSYESKTVWNKQISLNRIIKKHYITQKLYIDLFNNII